MDIDYLIVGAGLTGATIARQLIDTGKKVLVVDRRAHMGGNVFDHFHESGIRIHTYGPHYFRTDKESVWEFVNRFASFYKYEPSLRTLVDGQFEIWPIVGEFIKRRVGENWRPDFSGTPTNFEEAALSLMPRLVYEKFIKGYSEKQWGVPASTLSADLVKRFDVREDGETRLMRHKYQGIPHQGYAVFMQNILAGIPVVLNFDYLENRDVFKPKYKTIFTGPIDEFFDFEFGKLLYRGQKREHTYLADIDQYQPVGQVNNPDPLTGPHIRTLEWKQMMDPTFAQKISGTVISTETTYTPIDTDKYEYPFPDQKNKELYLKYRAKAETMMDTLLICGRLGEYRYYDMDHTIEKAMQIAKELL